MSKMIIAVVGATGAQGGGLARSILADNSGRFGLRAITRNPESAGAKALAAAGADVVKGDTDDVGSVTEAFAGADGAFCVTNYWEHLSPEREQTQAANMALAAREAGLEHVIWSTFEDTRKWVPLDDDTMPTLMDRYKVPHFDSKAEANRFFEEAGVPTTFLLTSFYWDNMIHFGMEPKAGPDGTLAITLPMGDKKLPGIAAEDIGKCAFGLFSAGQKYRGQTVGISGEQLTGQQMADALGQALGREVRYNSVTPEAFRGFGFPGAEDMGNMFQFKRDFEDYYCGIRDPEVARSLNPDLLTFAAWLEANADRIPIEG